MLACHSRLLCPGNAGASGARFLDVDISSPGEFARTTLGEDLPMKRIAFQSWCYGFAACAFLTGHWLIALFAVIPALIVACVTVEIEED